MDKEYFDTIIFRDGYIISREDKKVYYKIPTIPKELTDKWFKSLTNEELNGLLLTEGYQWIYEKTYTYNPSARKKILNRASIIRTLVGFCADDYYDFVDVDKLYRPKKHI